MSISSNIQDLVNELPENITIVAATKSRNINDIDTAINFGIEIIGENYVQEAQKKYQNINAKIHLIGHLQSNKIKKAVEIFDMIQTVDTDKIALEINKECQNINKIMSVLIEVNIGEELNKAGCMPTEVLPLALKISKMQNLKLTGLMTMAPFFENPEKTRPYFKKTKKLFDQLKEKFPNVKTLSMGMTHSYKIAIEEGSNMIRLGTKIFGER